MDSAIIESWHSTLKFELRSLEHFATQTSGRARVATWIEACKTRVSSPRLEIASRSPSGSINRPKALKVQVA